MCRADEDYNEEFGHGQFEMADQYLNEKRKERPDLEFELIAVIDGIICQWLANFQSINTVVRLRDDKQITIISWERSRGKN